MGPGTKLGGAKLGGGLELGPGTKLGGGQELSWVVAWNYDPVYTGI